MNDPAVQISETMQVAIAELPNIYRAITETAGIQLLEACCESCGIKIQADDLAALGGPPAESDSPKRERLRMQYCARNGCDSRFYRLTIGCNSENARNEAKNLGRAAMNAVCAQTRAPSSSVLTNLPLWKWVALVVSGAVLLFWLHHWYYGGRIPIFQEKHHYEAA